MDLLRLIYVSRARSTALHGRAIADFAQSFNSKHDLTGVLIATSRLYIQAIEGDPAVVRALYQRISADTRHQHPKILAEAECDLRLWPKWSMQLISASTWQEHAGPLAMADYEAVVAAGVDVCDRIYALHN